jgi:virginiamycin B lyase
VTARPSPSPTAAPTNAPAGRFREYQIPTQSASPVDIAAGPDGALWFTEAVGKIGRVTTAGEITEFHLDVGLSRGAIALGPDGALWFAEGESVGRMTSAGDSQTFTAVIGGNPYQVAGITAGPDGALWFTAQDRQAYPTLSAIDRITTSGQMTSFLLPLSRQPLGITTGPDGTLPIPVRSES